MSSNEPGHDEGTATARGPLALMIAEWQVYREYLAELERRGHPDLTDRFGRTWVWWKGDLYRHDDMAWPVEVVTDPRIGWPADSALDNPNYAWCGLCRARGAQ